MKINHFILAGAVAFSSLAAEAATITFNYTGAQQTFVVPAGVTTVHIDAQGAAGWSGPSNAGGLGGSASGNLSVTPGETLYVYVGGQGTAAIGVDVPMGGGFNGGGNGMNNSVSPNVVGGGGGASDIRKGGTALANRVLVAGGGGGATENGGEVGGAGGGLVGGSGGNGSTCCGGTLATGGSQVAGGANGGALGQGANATVGLTPWIGGGGGGYYGGGISDQHQAGGGGSSYLGGVTGGSTTAGVRSGNGVVVITYADRASPVAVPTLGEWGMLILSSLLALGTVFVLRQRKS